MGCIASTSNGATYSLNSVQPSSAHRTTAFARQRHDMRIASMNTARVDKKVIPFNSIGSISTDLQDASLDIEGGSTARSYPGSINDTPRFATDTAVIGVSVSRRRSSGSCSSVSNTGSSSGSGSGSGQNSDSRYRVHEGYGAEVPADEMELDLGSPPPKKQSPSTPPASSRKYQRRQRASLTEEYLEHRSRHSSFASEHSSEKMQAASMRSNGSKKDRISARTAATAATAANNTATSVNAVGQ